ncbi:S9 family peptidase [Microbacterium tumbae]
MTGRFDELTPEDLVSLRLVNDPRVSDDGAIRACVVSDPPPRRPASARSDIWVSRGDEPMAPLTAGPGSKGLPRISPGGGFLAYASDADEAGSPRLRVISATPGERSAEERYDHVPGFVEDILWSVDESALLVLTLEDDPGNGGVRRYMRHVTEAEKAASVVVRRPSHAWQRLYLVDRATGAVDQVSPDHLSVWEAAWTGSGPVAAIVSETPREDGWFDPQIAMLDLGSKGATVVYDPEYQVQGLALTADGSRLAFAESPQSDRSLLAGQITILDLAGGGVERPVHDGDVTSLRWLRDGRLFWAGVIRSESAFGFAERTASGQWAVDTTWQGRATLGRSYRVSAECSADGGVVVGAYQAHNVPHEFREFRIGADAGAAQGGWVALTRMNEELAGRSSAVESVLRWSAPDGLEIEGLLLLPADRPDGPLPLVVVPHGGPSNVTTSVFASGAHSGDALLMTQAGCAVLMPNPRGSTGRGRAFTSANIGDLGGGDLRDIEAGVDALVASGLADPARVGIVGLSYGGFMSAWAAVKSDRFVASIPISGITDWLSFHNTSVLQLFGKMFLQGEPYDAAGPYLPHSPVMFVEGCRTATLILHGDLDVGCPIGQALEFYQGLAGAGCETELAIYQGAGHGMTEAGQMVDVSRRIVDWFTRHLALQPASMEPVPA